MDIARLEHTDLSGLAQLGHVLPKQSAILGSSHHHVQLVCLVEALVGMLDDGVVNGRLGYAQRGLYEHLQIRHVHVLDVLQLALPVMLLEPVHAVLG